MFNNYANWVMSNDSKFQLIWKIYKESCGGCAVNEHTLYVFEVASASEKYSTGQNKYFAPKEMCDDENTLKYCSLEEGSEKDC